MQTTEILDTLNKLKKDTGKWQYKKVAKLFGCTESTIKQIANGSMHVYGTSNLYDEKGNLKLSWVKTKYKNDELLQNWQRYFENMVANKVKARRKIHAPKKVISNKFSFYPLPDLHLGMLIEGSETQHGIDYNLDIAEQWINESICNFINNTPKTDTAIICDLGDLLHASDDSNRTKSGHWLDVSNKHYKVFEVTTKIFTNMIEKLLTHHKNIIFYSVAGNHSDLVPIYLKTFLSGYFKNNSRVKIVMDNKAQQYYIQNKVILGFSHGHQLKPEKAAQVLIYDNKDDFSKSEYRYFHFGHFHHNKVIQSPLCDIEIHKNLPPRDAWAESMGFRGHIGECKCIVYDDNMGEVFRFTSKLLNKPI